MTATSGRVRRVPAALVGVAVVTLTVLTGCGSGEGDGGAVPRPTPSDGRRLVQDATAALNAAETFHVAGTFGDDQTKVDIDLDFGSGGEAEGTVDIGAGRSFEVRRVADGTVYVRLSDGFLAALTMLGTDVSQAADVWVEIDDDAPVALAGLVGVTDRNDLVAKLEPDGGTYTLSGPETVRGVSAYVATNEDGDTFAAAADGPPLPVELTEGGGQGEIVFDRYDEPVTVDAPPQSEIGSLGASS